MREVRFGSAIVRVPENGGGLAGLTVRCHICREKCDFEIPTSLGSRDRMEWGWIALFVLAGSCSDPEEHRVLSARFYPWGYSGESATGAALRFADFLRSAYGRGVRDTLRACASLEDVPPEVHSNANDWRFRHCVAGRFSDRWVILGADQYGMLDPGGLEDAARHMIVYPVASELASSCREWEFCLRVLSGRLREYLVDAFYDTSRGPFRVQAALARFAAHALEFSEGYEDAFWGASLPDAELSGYAR